MDTTCEYVPNQTNIQENLKTKIFNRHDVLGSFASVTRAVKSVVV